MLLNTWVSDICVEPGADWSVGLVYACKVGGQECDVRWRLPISGIYVSNWPVSWALLNKPPSKRYHFLNFILSMMTIDRTIALELLYQGRRADG
eukprot:scaffold18798_cov36-Prasinocladus_malaysianus.AAC.1